MSSLGFCNLDEAFKTNANIKKSRKNRKTDDNMMEKILGRGKDIQGSILPGDGPPKPSTDMDHVNSIPETYDQNSLFAQERQKERQNELSNTNKDIEPNNIQNNENNKAIEMMESLRMEILDLKKEITILKEPSSESFREPLRETFTNYNIDNNLVNRFKSGITFDNDQFNELLLYVFTGIFLLILIDYIFNLGKKAF